MPRPRRPRRIHGTPSAFFYKPQGVSLRQLEVIELSLEEFEALRLKNVELLNQHACAVKMQISQSTFHRTYAHAIQKVSRALTSGKAIRIATT